MAKINDKSFSFFKRYDLNILVVVLVVVVVVVVVFVVVVISVTINEKSFFKNLRALVFKFRYEKITY